MNPNEKEKFLHELKSNKIPFIMAKIDEIAKQNNYLIHEHVIIIISFI